MKNWYVKVAFGFISMIVLLCLVIIVYMIPKKVDKDVFTIRKWQTVKVDNLKIKLEKITDTRCDGLKNSNASYTQCIWQGEIIYYFKVSTREGSKKYELSTELAKKIDILDGYSLEIVGYNESKNVTLKLIKNV